MRCRRRGALGPRAYGGGDYALRVGDLGPSARVVASRTAGFMERMRRPLQLAVIMLGVIYAVGVALGFAAEGGDAGAYWLADPMHPYVQSTLGSGHGYLYSPAFAQAIEPLRLLGWPAFLFIWTVLLAVALSWTAGSWGIVLVVLPPVFVSIALGNIEVFLATAVVVGFRWPAVWSFVLLTKVTPGVGLAWFAVRREWRSLAVALGATLAIAAVSFAIAPSAWPDWFASLQSNAAVTFPGWLFPGPLWLRILLALLLTSWGGLQGRRWTVPVACAVAAPVAYGTVLAIALVGVTGVLRRRS